MGESLPTHHEEYIAGRGDNSFHDYYLVHKFIPMPQAMKIPAAKAALDSSFCIFNGHLSSEKCWVGGKAPEIQRSSCTLWWYCKRQFRILRSIHRTRIFSISNDSGQNHAYHLQIARFRCISSRCTINLYPKWKMVTKYEKLQNQNFETFGFVHHDTNGRNHGPVCVPGGKLRLSKGIR